MRKLAVCFLFAALSLWAADFWQSKKFTDWSGREVQKMLDSSPWAKSVSVPGELVTPGGGATRRSRDGGRGAIGEIGNPNGAAPDPMDQPARSGAGRAAQNADVDRDAAPMLTFTVRWESALPVRMARMRAKYGSEADTSPEVQKILATEEPNYVITVTGARLGSLGGDAEAIKKQAMADAELIIKGRDPIKPVDFMLERGNGVGMAVFAFPKSAPVSAGEKEVEFFAKFDSVPVRQKFQLKNMTFAGRLEL